MNTAATPRVSEFPRYCGAHRLNPPPRCRARDCPHPPTRLVRVRFSAAACDEKHAHACDEHVALARNDIKAFCDLIDWSCR